MKRNSLLVIFAAVTCFLSTPQALRASDAPVGNWIKYGILFFNLDELLKIEVDGEHVRFIRRDNALLAEDPKADADALQSLRTAVSRNTNWVRVSSERKGDQEWYVNLDHVPEVLAAEMQGIIGVSLVYGPDKPKSLGVSPSNETSNTIMDYVSKRLSH